MPARPPVEGHWRRQERDDRQANRRSAARRLKEPKAERHGARGWGPSAPLPGSTEADATRRASRRSASPVLRSARRQACGRGLAHGCGRARSRNREPLSRIEVGSSRLRHFECDLGQARDQWRGAAVRARPPCMRSQRSRRAFCGDGRPSSGAPRHLLPSGRRLGRGSERAAGPSLHRGFRPWANLSPQSGRAPNSPLTLISHFVGWVVASRGL